MKFLAYVRVELEIDTADDVDSLTTPEDIAYRLGVVTTFNVPVSKMKQVSYAIDVHPVAEKIDGI